MYLYSFSKFSGPDKIFTLNKGNEFYKKIKTGDLLKFGDDAFICLGDEISFSEMYNYPYQTALKPEILRKKLLSKNAIKMIHWMIYNYYSTYKSVIKYFVSQEWEQLLKREGKGKIKNVKTLDSSMLTSFLKSSILKDTSSFSKGGQILVVFPDLRTILNMVDEKMFDAPGVAFLHSKQTQNQKDKHRWSIKTGQVDLIIASPSEIFQDFKDLQKIVFIDPHKWYYASQQDPRYKVGMVLEEMKKVYDVEIEIVNN